MNAGRDLHLLAPGFDDTVINAEQTFRAILDAMGHPGQVVQTPNNLPFPKALNSASAATCLTWLDYETPVWTDLDWDNAAVGWLQFHCGCSIVTEPCMANYALITKPSSMPALDEFRIGDDEHPEAGSTLIIQIDVFAAESGGTVFDPGIQNRLRMTVSGLPIDFWRQRRQQTGLFPRGVDIFFTCQDQLIALPRTSRLE
jgi:alpha-D-ribose 1-methylphosphonate 5-triphosphate synthase subunit PhnH